MSLLKDSLMTTSSSDQVTPSTGLPSSTSSKPKAPSSSNISRRTTSSRGERLLSLSSVLVLVLSLLLAAGGVAADWDSDCPAKCKCTYVSNRKVAKCEDADYTVVPSTLSPEIQELVLSNNKIKHIDKDEFQKAGLVNLQVLILTSNEISYVDKDAFSGLKILIELDLKGNRIDQLHPHTFTGMEKLRKLDLTGNQISRLEAHQFPELLHLQSLRLDNCNIDYLHNYAFANLPNVSFLGLSNNMLEFVQPDLFSSNGRLVSLELANNRWLCDCKMRPFASWMAEKFQNTNWNCFSPARLKGAHWEDVPLPDFACEPEMDVSQEYVNVVVGSHASISCWATGDPIPALKWVAGNRVLSNMTSIANNSTDKYVVKTFVNNSVVYSTLELGIYREHHPFVYACVATNPANDVKKTVTVVVGGDDIDRPVQSRNNMYLMIGIIVALILVLLIVLIGVLCFCWMRRKPSTTTPHSKLNGSAGDHGSVLVVPPPNSINPIGKPPRQYEKLPQKDIEMTHLVNTSIEGGHKSYEELNYPHGNPPTYADSRPRLPPLVEEGMAGHPSSPYLLQPPAPSPTLTLQSNITQTTTSHYPDLLDNARVPRTISPTQMSYQSLAYPPLGQDWRFSYAHPADYNGTASEYGRSPVAYSTPQHQRPGYVTLPRRPGAPSWSGVPTPNPHIVANPMLSPQTAPHSTIYDTLGPRTTADGTSTTDLTRPGSRAALYEPFPPNGAVVQATSPMALAAQYNSRAAHKYNSPRHNYHGQARPGTSQTLPRSTPNLLEDNSLSIPQYRPMDHQRAVEDPYSSRQQPLQVSEEQPLIEDDVLGGALYDSTFQYDSSNADEATNLIYNASNNHPSNNNNHSKNNYNNVKSSGSNLNKPQQRQTDIVNRNLKSASPSISPSDKSSNKTLNSSMSPCSPSPIPTPTQILSSASPHSDQQAARPSPSNDLPNANGYPSHSGSSSSSNGAAAIGVVPSPIISPSNTSTLGKKKVPPKPPPKPSSKRLSVSSMTSDSGTIGGGSGNSRKVSVTSGPYLDDGPDGSEV